MVRLAEADAAGREARVGLQQRGRDHAGGSSHRASRKRKMNRRVIKTPQTTGGPETIRTITVCA